MARSQRIRTSRERMENWLAWDGGPATTASWVAAFGLAGLLGVTILRGATGGPEWLLAWRIATVFLLYTGTLVVGRHLFTADPGSRTKWELFTVRLGLLAVLLALVYQSGSPRVGLGVDRISETIAIWATVVGFCVLADDPREYSQKQWLVLWGFAAVSGAFFFHTLGVSAGSLAARQPLWAAVIMGVSLAVLPRYLPSELLLWTMSRVAAVVVLLGLLTYVFGEYALLGVQFRFHGAFPVPGLGTEVPAIRSLLVNRNAFAIVVFSGLVGAVAEFHRTFVRRRTVPALAVPAVLMLVNAVGFVVSFGRALWVIGVMSLGIYLAYVALGRDVVPAAVVVGGAYVVGGIIAVYLAVRLGYLASDPSDRFHLWGASLAAILDRPSLLGEGMISTSQHILEYRDGDAPASPHNSYLSIWIRGGLVGGLGYLVLNVASLVEGARRYRGVDVAVLALATAFVAHQLFESYTLFSWRVGSVFASLAIGFLAFGVDRKVESPAGEDGSASGTTDEEPAEERGSPPSESVDEDAAGDVRSSTPVVADDGSAADVASPPVVPEEEGGDESSPVPADEDDASPPAPAEDESPDGDSSPPVLADEESSEDESSPPVLADEESSDERSGPPVAADDEDSPDQDGPSDEEGSRDGT